MPPTPSLIKSKTSVITTVITPYPVPIITKNLPVVIWFFKNKSAPARTAKPPSCAISARTLIGITATCQTCLAVYCFRPDSIAL